MSEEYDRRRIHEKRRRKERKIWKYFGPHFVRHDRNMKTKKYFYLILKANQYFYASPSSRDTIIMSDSGQDQDRLGTVFVSWLGTGLRSGLISGLHSRLYSILDPELNWTLRRWSLTFFLKYKNAEITDIICIQMHKTLLISSSSLISEIWSWMTSILSSLPWYLLSFKSHDVWSETIIDLRSQLKLSKNWNYYGLKK